MITIINTPSQARKGGKEKREFTKANSKRVLLNYLEKSEKEKELFSKRIRAQIDEIIKQVLTANFERKGGWCYRGYSEKSFKQVYWYSYFGSITEAPAYMTVHAMFTNSPPLLVVAKGPFRRSDMRLGNEIILRKGMQFDAVKLFHPFWTPEEKNKYLESQGFNENQIIL